MADSTKNQTSIDPVDPRELRNAFGQFATGVTVVTCRSDDGVPHGATVNAFTAVSLDPPLAQVTLTRTSRAAQYLHGGPFAINILSQDQLDVAWHFAGKPLPYEPAWSLDGSVPVLLENKATLECTPWRIYDGGDHIIVIGEVQKLEVTHREPLLFFGGKFRDIGPLTGSNHWQHCGDSLESRWFSGADSFTSLIQA